MSNPFSGIISENFKNLFSNAISALLYNDALTVPCTISYGVTKYENCVNCVYDSIGQKSANRHLSGGPIPFPFGGICPMCDGAGKRSVETTEVINLMVIWDKKDFINVATIDNIPDTTIQILTFASNSPKLKRAKEIIVANNLESYTKHRYVRDSELVPCGAGFTDNFVHCLFKRVG